MNESDCCLRDGQQITGGKKKKIALHKFFVSGCISFGGGGQNLPRIPSSEGIKGVCGDNAPACQMLRDDPRQGHQILAKPSVTPLLFPFPSLPSSSSPSACRDEPEERHGTRNYVVDLIKRALCFCSSAVRGKVLFSMLLLDLRRNIKKSGANHKRGFGV